MDKKKSRKPIGRKVKEWKTKRFKDKTKKKRKKDVGKREIWGGKDNENWRGEWGVEKMLW